MFRRDAHRAMEEILHAFDADALEAHGFALAGATRISLALGEVRESADLDFVGSDSKGYAALRAAVRDRGYAALFRDLRRRSARDYASSLRRASREAKHSSSSGLSALGASSQGVNASTV